MTVLPAIPRRKLPAPETLGRKTRRYGVSPLSFRELRPLRTDFETIAVTNVGVARNRALTGFASALRVTGCGRPFEMCLGRIARHGINRRDHSLRRACFIVRGCPAQRKDQDGGKKIGRKNASDCGADSVAFPVEGSGCRDAFGWEGNRRIM